MRPRPAVCAALLVLSGSAAGCAFHGPEAAQRCDWMTGKGSGGRTAFLVDVSNSTRGTSGPDVAAPDYRNALSQYVEDAVDRLDTVSVAAFSGKTTDLVWNVENLSTDFKAGNNNPDNQADRRVEAVECTGGELAGALGAAPSAAGTDVLGAMRNAVEWLNAGPEPRTLVVATDGLITTGCADLTRSAFSSDREIATITKLCGQREEVNPALLKTVRVDLVGVGRPSSDQPVPTPRQARWLNSLWRSLCGATCEVSSAPVAGNVQLPSTAKTRKVPDEPVGFQSGKQVYALPSLLLFDTDSSSLRPQARPVLEDISVSIRTTDYAHVDVKGYADPRGDEVHNRKLSLQRAQAVAQALGPAIGGRPHGMGATRSCPYAMSTSEPADGDDLPCARRVEIVVTTKEDR